MQPKKLGLAKAALPILIMSLILVVGAWASDQRRVREDGTDEKVTVTVLYNFGGQMDDPLYPQRFIAQGRDGNLYATTPYGGALNDGTVYKMTPSGQLTVLYDLVSYNGSTGLMLGTDGNFYGTAVYGGADRYGSVFRITSGGQMEPLYDFTGQDFDDYPDAPPVEGRDGDFYGTTLGGFNGDGGEVYKMTPSGVETSLFRFDRTDGANPADPLIQGTDGNFYGTTNTGGASGRCEQYGCGTVFRVTPDGGFRLLHSFNVKDLDGYYPDAPVVAAADGSLYGTVPNGGRLGGGIIFKITPSGEYTILHNFKYGNGADLDTGLVQAADGYLYGATGAGGKWNKGTIYKISLTGKFSTMYSFDGTVGLGPTSLMQGTDGKFYGTAIEGGTYNYGTVFSVDLGLEAFASLVSTSGKVGKLVEILGQGFTGTTKVSFNGTSAQFNVVSDTYLTARVPAKATSGFVTVVTPGGKLRSNKRFQVME